MRRNSQKASVLGIYFFTCKVYIQVFIVCVTTPIVPELLHDNKQKCNASKESPLNASSFRLNPVLFNISYLCFSFKEPTQRQTLSQLWVDLSLDHCSKLCALSLNNSLVMPCVTLMSLARMYARE